METMQARTFSYKYIGIILIVLMRLFHEPYKWAQTRWELPWEQTGQLAKWWIFTACYSILEYVVFIAIVTLIGSQGKVRLTRGFAFIAADLAGVFFLLSLGGTMSVDPILRRTLAAIGLNYASFLMYGLAFVWFCFSVYRGKSYLVWASAV